MRYLHCGEEANVSNQKPWAQRVPFERVLRPMSKVKERVVLILSPMFKREDMAEYDSSFRAF